MKGVVVSARVGGGKGAGDGQGSGTESMVWLPEERCNDGGGRERQMREKD